MIRFAMYCCVIQISTLAFAQNPESVELPNDSKQRAKEMKWYANAVSLAVIEKVGKENAWVDGKPVEKAALNFQDATRDEFGSLWVWTSKGAPVVVAEIFTQWAENHYWGYNFISVAEPPVRVESSDFLWETERGRRIWQDIPDADPPVKQRTLRLAQMRRLARKFKAVLLHGGRTELRLLSQPVYRHPKDAEHDGAIFCFVHGNTNPEMVLLIREQDGRWQFMATRACLSGFEFTYNGKKMPFVRDNNKIAFAEYAPGEEPFLTEAQRYPWK